MGFDRQDVFGPDWMSKEAAWVLIGRLPDCEVYPDPKSPTNNGIWPKVAEAWEAVDGHIQMANASPSNCTKSVANAPSCCSRKNVGKSTFKAFW